MYGPSGLCWCSRVRRRERQLVKEKGEVSVWRRHLHLRRFITSRSCACNGWLVLLFPLPNCAEEHLCATRSVCVCVFAVVFSSALMRQPYFFANHKVHRALSTAPLRLLDWQREQKYIKRHQKKSSNSNGSSQPIYIPSRYHSFDWFHCPVWSSHSLTCCLAQHFHCCFVWWLPLLSVLFVICVVDFYSCNCKTHSHFYCLKQKTIFLLSMHN